MRTTPIEFINSNHYWSTTDELNFVNQIQARRGMSKLTRLYQYLDNMEKRVNWLNMDRERIKYEVVRLIEELRPVNSQLPSLLRRQAQ